MIKSQKKIINHFNAFRESFIKRVIPEPYLKEDPLTFWRSNVLFTLLFTAFLFFSLSIIAVFILAFKENDFRLAIFDLVAYGLCIYILFSRRLNYKTRASITLMLCYMVGLAITISVGPMSSGPLWLFTFAILVGVLLGTKFAIAAVAMNGITLTSATWLMSTGNFGQPFPFPISLQAIVSTWITFIVLNFVATISITVLVKGLVLTHQKQKDLASNLEKEHKQLISTKVKLELEVKERKQAEEKYRFLADHVNDMIWMINLSDLQLTYVSPSVKKIRGFSPEETMKQSLDEILIPESYQKVSTTLEQELKNDKDRDPDRFLTLELEQYRRDGSIVCTEVTSSFVRNNDKFPIAILGITRDISERKEAEKVLWEKEEKLTRLKKMESLGLMASGIAHDLNNILSGIVSYPDVLLFKLPKDSPLRKPIETIKESGLRAAAVVSDLLTVAKGVAAGIEVSNLNMLIEQYLNSPEHKNLKRTRPDINFRTELDPNLLNINGSTIHLKKVLMNLASNAADAIENKGTVVLSTTNCYLDEPLKGYDDIQIGEYILLKISDNGIGMSPEHLQRIFEPFYTKKILSRSGTGLGLAIVWNTVKDHDGYINVTSDHEGTEFEIFMPATRKELDHQRHQVPFEEYLGKGEKILVVDDEKNQRDIACDLLNQLGYRSESVSSGEKAIEYLEKNSVDLILLDMIMPGGLSGNVTYQKITHIYPQQKAIIASGYAETDAVKETQKLGAGKYIKKPYTLEEIGIAIKKELENS
ncbi:MAG: response regulator [Desulfobacterales bacterium]|nr:response regulator [Desulfobacterales bacterium]